jgi:3-methylcrotonyl-CoA carboxylase alpha subunit
MPMDHYPIMESVLIANRGEIARRIMRTARRLGIRTVAVFSEADRHLPFVREADVAVPIGPAPARDSYLVAEKILSAAHESGASAIHPGYGFQSENAAFAEAVQAAGLIWVGPPASAMRAMGLKDAAKLLMQQAGVPVTPGYMGEDNSQGRLQEEADSIGYPVLIKAVAGGGGRGMRRVDRADDFAEALDACQREARAAFGEDRVLLEKYILSPRHIEVQVFGDSHGNIVHLFERDCSLQRRHQKVIEEAPAPGMDASTREALCAAAVRAAAAVGYEGAGTVEFIADMSDGLRADRIWFMEMNTRLQVEHPVTEAITGQDLVEWQLRVACGQHLPLRQHELRIHGWAMEARLYAENPAAGFLPSTGRLDHVRLADGLRVDSGVEQGDEVTAFYDPMIAKLIVHANTRKDAARRLAEACARTEVWPVRTNAAFLARAAADADFVAGRVDTGFIERKADALVPSAEPSAAVLRAAARAVIPDGSSDPWTALAGFRIGADAWRQVLVQVGGKNHLVEASEEPARGRIVTLGSTQVLFLDGEAWRFGIPAAEAPGQAVTSGTIMSPMPGQILNVSVAEGELVTKGQLLMVIGAMKMELRMEAPFDGTISDVLASAGSQVAEGVVLLRVNPVEKKAQ